MDRRGFLSPALAFPVIDDEFASSELALVRTERRAMAASFEIILPFGLPDASAASADALDLIDQLEDQLTVYRSHSEISLLNEKASHAETPVEPRLFRLLELAAGLTVETGGAFDIAAGALIKTWGFYRRAGRVPSVAERAEAMQCTGMRYVVLNRERESVRFLRPGLELNLGAIGKGYALDRAAELLHGQWGIRSALLHGGTSSVLAVGSPPGQAGGWTVSLSRPGQPGSSLGNVRLRDQALGTSAATFQSFEYNGRKLSHVLDPRRGWPAEGFEQVSVIAGSAAEADALSTALFVMGPAAAAGYCRTHPGIGAVMLPVGNSSEPLVFNLPPGAFVPSSR